MSTPTTLTISAPSTASVNHNFTINGTLSAGTTGIGSRTITLQRSTNNATYTNVTMNVTDANGNYQFSTNESVAGTYYYRTAYAGNASYNNATSNVVNVTVSGGGWGAWTSLGGQLALGSSPAASVLNGSTSVYLFVNGTNGALWQNIWNGSKWSGWSSLGGALSSSPAATSPASGVIDVFVRGSDAALWTKHYSGGVWGAWKSLGGQIPAGTSPAACSWGASREDVFVEGTNGALYQNTWNGSGWSGWTSLGGQLTSSPAAASPTSGTIDVFVRGTNGALYERIYTGG